MRILSAIWPSIHSNPLLADTEHPTDPFIQAQEKLTPVTIFINVDGKVGIPQHKETQQNEEKKLK